MLITILVGVGSYAAGIFTAAAIVLHRRELARPIARKMIPASEPMPPPRQRGEPPCASPFAPRPKPPAAAKPPAPVVERPRRKQIHWPIARAEKEAPPTMVKVEPQTQAAAIPPPKPPTIATSIALPDVEFGRGP